MNDFKLFEKALEEYKKISIYEQKETKPEIKSEADNEVKFTLKSDDSEEYINMYNNPCNNPYNNLSNNPCNLDVKTICTHKNIINENSTVLCVECGKELEKSIFQDKEWRYYGQSDTKRTSDPNRVHIRKIDDRSIYKDVDNMGFSEKIISLANQIYIQVTKGQIYRGNSRKAIVFACIFHSFKLNGKPQTHENLIEIFGLSRKISLKGLKLVNLNVPKDSPIHTTYITPVNLIEDIMNKFKATSSQKKEVIELYNKIKNKSSKINRSRPQSISSGLIYYWISLKNIEITLKDFAKKVDLSELTITKIAKEISDILGVLPESWY